MKVTTSKIDMSLELGDRVIFDEYQGVSLLAYGGEYILADNLLGTRMNFSKDAEAAKAAYKSITRDREIREEYRTGGDDVD